MIEVKIRATKKDPVINIYTNEFENRGSFLGG